MKYIQIICALLALAAVVLQLGYLHGIGNLSTNIQPLTSLLYVVMFLALGVYARIAKPLDGLLSLRPRTVRWAVVVMTIGIIAFSMAVFQKSVIAHSEMAQFGIINSILGFGYLLFAVTLLFGDGWLGVVAKMLKFGRGGSNKPPTG